MSHCEKCSGNCSSCGESCSERKPQSFLAEPNKNSNVKKVIAVMSGKGGDLLLETCRKVLDEEYPEHADKIQLKLPDEKFRRVGQSMAAASLPKSK